MFRKPGAGVGQCIFTGHEYDADSGLSFMNARYYNAVIGRFTSQDPAYLNLEFDLTDPQSLNSYTYARNNPLRYNDPNGEWFWDVVDAVQTAWDGSRAMQSVGNYLGDQVTKGIGKATGSTNVNGKQYFLGVVKDSIRQNLRSK